MRENFRRGPLRRESESTICAGMAARRDEEESVPVPLDAETRAWLARLSRVTGDSPGRMIASMLRDIRLDDEAAHSQLH